MKPRERKRKRERDIVHNYTEHALLRWAGQERRKEGEAKFLSINEDEREEETAASRTRSNLAVPSFLW